MNSLIVIGASTGGPEALAAVLCGLPKDFSVPIVVVQHILPDFTGTFAKRLDKKCNLVVREGKQGDILRPGHVYIAPSGKHLIFRHGKIDLDDEPLVNFVKPSVDVTMKSAARLFRKNAIGIILTGSGSDGTVGVKAIKKAKGITIAQDKHTSVIFDMPGNAIESGNIDYVLAVEDIADKIMELVKGR